MPHKGRHEADDKLAVLLAGGMTNVEAARVCGLGEKTVRVRLQTPAFIAKVQEIRAEMIRRAAGGLADTMAKATAKLAELLDHKDPNVVARSANSLLGHAVSVTKLADLDARLRALELDRPADAESLQRGYST